MIHRSGTPAALLLTVALHLALLLALLSPFQRPASPQGDRAAIQWLLAAPWQAARPALAHKQAETTLARNVRRPAARPSQAQGATQATNQAAIQEARRDPTPAASTDPVPAAVQSAAREAAPDDVFASGAPASSASAAQLLRQAAHGAGAVDRALRDGKAAPLASGGQVLQGKIDAAFREAVARRWHDPATLQEISTPGDRVRVYKMTTMGGTVCVTVPDPSLEKFYRLVVTNCPRENERGDVSPAVDKPSRAQR